MWYHFFNQNEKITSILRLHEDEITGLLPLPDSKLVLTCSLDGTLVCLDTETPKPRDIINIEMPVRCMTARAEVIVLLSNSNTLIFLAGKNGFTVDSAHQEFEMMYTFNLTENDMTSIKIIGSDLYFCTQFREVKRFALANASADVGLSDSRVIFQK